MTQISFSLKEKRFVFQDIYTLFIFVLNHIILKRQMLLKCKVIYFCSANLKVKCFAVFKIDFFFLFWKCRTKVFSLSRFLGAVKHLFFWFNSVITLKLSIYLLNIFFSEKLLTLRSIIDDLFPKVKQITNFCVLFCFFPRSI